MPTVSASGSLQFPTLFELTKRVRREVTRETLSTLNDDPINNVIVDSLNDGIEDIYYKNRWNWKKLQYNVPLVAAQQDYALPPDFYQMAVEATYNGLRLREVDPEEWTRYTFDPTLTAQGGPAMYMVDRTLFRVFPAPSSGAITVCPTVGVTYYRRPPARLTITSDSSHAPDLPPEFIEALVAFGKWKLKIHLQYDDFQLDEKRYMETVQKQIENDYLSVHPVRLRPRRWTSANFG